MYRSTWGYGGWYPRGYLGAGIGYPYYGYPGCYPYGCGYPVMYGYGYPYY